MLKEEEEQRSKFSAEVLSVDGNSGRSQTESLMRRQECSNAADPNTFNELNRLLSFALADFIVGLSLPLHVETADLFQRTMIAVNQLRMYGAVVNGYKSKSALDGRVSERGRELQRAARAGIQKCGGNWSIV